MHWVNNKNLHNLLKRRILFDFFENVKKQSANLFKKDQPHRVQILWGCRQGSYPLALYVWSVPKTRVRAFYQAQWQLYCNIVDSYDDFRAKISRNFLQIQNEFRCNKLKNKQA